MSVFITFLVYNIYAVGKILKQVRAESDRITTIVTDYTLISRWKLRLMYQSTKYYRTVINSIIWRMLLVYDDGSK